MEEGLLETIRRHELTQLRGWIKTKGPVLEIGGDRGFQAGLLASGGCRVQSIDLENRPKSGELFYPVQDYSGGLLPFADATFDLVFSSNVLEHVRDLTLMLREIQRVLRPGGQAIHILPSSTWRWWTSLAHYPHLVRSAFVRLRGTGAVRPLLENPSGPATAPARPFWQRLFAGAHGEYSNALVELFAYSRVRWNRVFAEHGFEVEEAGGLGLFYTGYALAPSLSIHSRRLLSRFLGSSCSYYLMRSASPGTKR
jgi:SAM-dependent methyltransferase